MEELYGVLCSDDMLRRRAVYQIQHRRECRELAAIRSPCDEDDATLLAGEVGDNVWQA